MESDSTGNEDTSRCAIDSDGGMCEGEVSSVSVCDVKNGGGRGEIM